MAIPLAHATSRLYYYSTTQISARLTPHPQLCLYTRGTSTYNIWLTLKLNSLIPSLLGGPACQRSNNNNNDDSSVHVPPQPQPHTPQLTPPPRRLTACFYLTAGQKTCPLAEHIFNNNNNIHLNANQPTIETVHRMILLCGATIQLDLQNLLTLPSIYHVLYYLTLPQIIFVSFFSTFSIIIIYERRRNRQQFRRTSQVLVSQSLLFCRWPLIPTLSWHVVSSFASSVPVVH